MGQFPNRVALWPNKLAPDAPLMNGLCSPVQVADGQTAGESVHFTAVVPGTNNHYLRTTGGEAGLLEDQTLVKVVNETITADVDQSVRRPIVTVIDVPSQAYGCHEEAFGTHQALTGATGAYAKTRLVGYPVIGLIVGEAISGVFLTHSYQTDRLIALNDSGVLTHMVSKESAARIMLRTMEALEELATTIPLMAHDVSSYTTPGLLSALLNINNPDVPDEGDLLLVGRTLRDAIVDTHRDVSLEYRLGAESCRNP